MQSKRLHTSLPKSSVRLAKPAARLAKSALRLGRSTALRAASLLVVAALFGPAACSKAATGPVVTAHAAIGDTSVTVELARTREAQARGLMFRTELAENAGMLFVFDEEDERSFWMSNTPIPLDILYVRTDGTIRTIAARTTPYSEKSIPSRGPVRYVMEVPGGWSERHGVKPGDTLTLPEMDETAQPGD